MIIVCKTCRASFLVPASTFSGGARTVRCAKCKSVWKELPPTKGTAAKPQTTDPSKQQSSPRSSDTIKPSDLKITPPPLAPQENAATDSETETSPRTKVNWLAGLKNLVLIGLLFVLGFTLFSGAVLVAGQRYIVTHWPSTQSFYIELGLNESTPKDDLTLQNITSERRYIDGAMQLFITGEVLNNASNRLVIPTIFVEGVGPDGHIIESWRISPPTATIESGKTVPFSASFLSPEGTVVEVNLSFVEPPHAEQ